MTEYKNSCFKMLISRSKIDSRFFGTLIQGVSKKRNLFELEYLKDGLIKLIVLLACYLILQYNSVNPGNYTYTLKFNIFAPESHGNIE